MNLFNKIKRKWFVRNKKRARSKISLGFSRFSKKKVKKIRKYNFKNSIVISLLILLLLLLVFWIGFCIYKVINLKLNLAYKDSISQDREDWTAEDKINLLLVGMDSREDSYGYIDALAILMLDPRDHSVGIFNINSNVSVFLAEQDKYVKIKSLYNEGIFSGNSVPISLVIQGVEDLTSIRIDRYIMLNEDETVNIVDSLGGVYINNSQEIIDKDISGGNGSFNLKSGSFRLTGNDFLNYLRVDDDGVDNKLMRQVDGLEGFLKRVSSYMLFIKFPYIIDEISDEVYTDLTKKELFYFAYEVMRLSDIRSSYMKESSLNKVDGILLVVEDELDKDIQTVFIDNSVGKEQARVEIFNSTSIKGLAAYRARWLRNIGVDVIRVGDSAEVFEKTTIYTREKGKYDNTINAVVESFPEEFEIYEGEMPGWVCTGDIIIVLGNNGEV